MRTERDNKARNFRFCPTYTLVLCLLHIHQTSILLLYLYSLTHYFLSIPGGGSVDYHAKPGVTEGRNHGCPRKNQRIDPYRQGRIRAVRRDSHYSAGIVGDY